ncbi:MAG: hypothetical protein LBL28_04220 [Treponema sp.]|jgi:hypothetical protein|nr:hypothetical protein [Treponema sp.]
MKTKIRLFVFIVLMSPFFMSCFTIINAINDAVESRPYDVVMDELIPVEETALVRFMIDMRRFNGVDVSKDWYITSARIPHVRIPAGQAELIFNANIARGNSVTTVRNVEASYFFEAGKTYTIQPDLEKKPRKSGKPQEFIYGVNIFDGIVKKLNKKSRVDYLPLFDTEERLR